MVADAVAANDTDCLTGELDTNGTTDESGCFMRLYVKIKSVFLSEIKQAQSAQRTEKSFLV